MTERFQVYKTIGQFHAWHINDNYEDIVVVDNIMHKYDADRLCAKLNQLNHELNTKECLIQQLKNMLNTDYYKESKHYQKEFIRVCEELAEVNQDYNQLKEENQELIQKKNDLKDLLMNSETVLEQKELQKIIYKMVYATIDDKINELEKKYEFGRTEAQACPMHNIQFGINVLKELKKELQHD